MEKKEKEVLADKRLFWFLKEGTNLNLSEPWVLDMFVQQTITRGRTEDIKALLKLLTIEELERVLDSIGRFVPEEVRMFWEDFIEDNK